MNTDPTFWRTQPTVLDLPPVSLFPPQGTFCMDEQYENMKQRYILQPPPKEKATEVAEMGRNVQENSLPHHMAGTPPIVWLWIPKESRKGSLVIAEWTHPACWIVLILLRLCKTFLIYKPQHWWISDMILKMWVDLVLFTVKVTAGENDTWTIECHFDVK